MSLRSKVREQKVHQDVRKLRSEGDYWKGDQVSSNWERKKNIFFSNEERENVYGKWSTTDTGLKRCATSGTYVTYGDVGKGLCRRVKQYSWVRLIRRECHDKKCKCRRPASPTLHQVSVRSPYMTRFVLLMNMMLRWSNVPCPWTATVDNDLLRRDNCNDINDGRKQKGK